MSGRCDDAFLRTEEARNRDEESYLRASGLLISEDEGGYKTKDGFAFDVAMKEVVTPMAKEGVKYDSGKLRMDLLPPDALEALARILTDGADKYGARNWEKGMKWSRPYAALLRHLLAWWGGQDTDPESGHPHLWHVLTNAVFLASYEQRKIGEDDRHWSGPKVQLEILPKEQVRL